MKENIDLYRDITITTEDGSFQLMVDGGFNYSDDYVTTLHTHAAYELFYVSKGTMQIVCSDRTLTLTNDMMLIIPPDYLHHTWSDDPKLQRYIISFGTTDITEESPFWALFHNMCPISFHDSSAIKDAFARFSRYYSAHPTVCRPLMAACFYEILYLLKEEVIFSTMSARELEQLPVLRSDNSNFEYRNYVIDYYINENFNGNISIRDLAEKAHFSERHIDRIMYANYGQSFKERIIYLRMQNAVKLLCESDMTLKAIANAVGYQTAYGFHLQFEKYYGMTPAAYRTLHRGKQTVSETKCEKSPL